LPPTRYDAAPAFSSSLLAWFFVVVWGSGYLATRIGLGYAPPFTFLVLRYSFGVVALAAMLTVSRRRQPLRWPDSRRQLLHIVVAGLLMHAFNLGGSHYAQYLGMSAGITALVLAAQPLLTAVAVSAVRHERLARLQWVGVALGLAGVAIVVWHKIDTRTMSWSAVGAALFALAAITAGTLYQRAYCHGVDLRTAGIIQFASSLALLVPLAVGVEGFPLRFGWPLPVAIAYLVIFASILAVNALHTLMRRGEATRVTSLLYLPPIVAVGLEWLLFSVRPSALTAVGIAITCAGVALCAHQRPAQQAESA
jgi:drug/metabolite transporter (DMT)-like permease